MKRIIITLATALAICSCLSNSNESKATKTIKAYMKAQVGHVYKPTFIQLDTFYSRITYRQDVMDAVSEVSKYKRLAASDWDNYARALSSRSIYEPVRTAHDKARWDKYNVEAKGAARSYIKNYGKYLDAWQFVLDAADNNDRNQVVGWWVTYNIKDGFSVSHEAYILSPDLSEVLAYFPDGSERDFKEIGDAINDLIEDRDLLLEYLGEFEKFKAKIK